MSQDDPDKRSWRGCLTAIVIGACIIVLLITWFIKG